VSTQDASPSSKAARTLGAGRDWRRRILLHHVPLAIASALGLVVLVALAPSHGGFSIQQLASPTGDVALVLLAATLLIGPANLLLRRRNPVSSYLRRDVGTWTAIWSIAHVTVGFQGHSGGVFGFVDFFVADGRPLTNSFGLGNWTGLAATVIVVLLLVISTDRSLRELKARPWKNLQRLSYALFALVVLHAIFYGTLRRMTSPFTVILVVTVSVVFLGQVIGIWLWQRRNSTHPAGRFVRRNVNRRNTTVLPEGAIQRHKSGTGPSCSDGR
jgi:sulfoxide reductase heme-binding subunit YedZ